VDTSRERVFVSSLEVNLYKLIVFY